jgi:TonB family protein
VRNQIILGLAFWSVNCVAQCRAPQFQAGRIFVREEDTVMESISMPLPAFRPANLACLAASMKERYRGRKSILIYIYSSPEAAQGDVFPMETSEWDAWAFRQLHAFYMFDASKHEEYLKILPAGGSWVVPGGPYSTRIDLPAKIPPHCRVEINNRCLIATDYLIYPAEALKRRESGTVVLAATITRGGKVDKVRVVKVEGVSPEAESLLAKAALLALSSEIFESSLHDDAVQITYSYVIDDSARYTDGEKVEWALPDKITISAKPDEQV